MSGARRFSHPLVNILLLLGVLPGIVITLSGCRSRFGKKLSFETIDQQESPGTGQVYPENDVYLVVISSTSEVGELDEWISEAAKLALLELDYSDYFALAVFRGYKPSTGYPIEITSVRRQKNTVTVEITLQDPLPGISVGDTVISHTMSLKSKRTGAGTKRSSSMCSRAITACYLRPISSLDKRV